MRGFDLEVLFWLVIFIFVIMPIVMAIGSVILLVIAGIFELFKPSRKDK